MSFKVPNQYRIRKGHHLASDDSIGPYGAFAIPFRSSTIFVIASAGFEKEAQGWEHVSASLPNRCPNWEEMSFLKDLFWDPEDLVLQFMVPKSLHINKAPYCLHLWRNPKHKIALPPASLVG